MLSPIAVIPRDAGKAERARNYGFAMPSIRRRLSADIVAALDAFV